MEFPASPSSPQTPISSLSPGGIRQFHLPLQPSAGRWDFLGRCCLRPPPPPPPPGLAQSEATTRKTKRKKSEVQPQYSPQCVLLQSFPYESSALAADALAEAANAAYLVMMAMTISQSSGLQVLDVLPSADICNQGSIRTQKFVSSRPFVFDRCNINPLEHERGGNIIEKIQKSLKTRAGKNYRKINDDGIVIDVSGLLPSKNNGNQRRSTDFFFGSSKQEEPDLNSISCFESLWAKSCQLVYQEKQRSCSQLRHATRIAYLGSSSEASNVSFGVNFRSMRVDPHKIREPSNDNKNNLKSEKEEKVLSIFPLLNGNLPKLAIDPASYIKTYNLLLRDARLKECVDVLESMERKELLDMDKVHHISFLKVCKDCKAVHEALRFCKLIRNPTMSTFNMLLSVCASSQDFEGAFQVMLLIKEAGLTPDCKLYTTLISTCAKSGKVDAMFEVFHEMVNAGIEPNVYTYGSLIDGCARAGQVAKAFGAYGIMRSKKVQPDRVVFNALITACGESGAVDRAFDVLAEMKAEPKPIEPDHVTVGALMKACIQAGQIDRTREVYNMLHEYNIRGTPEVYTIAVRSCSKIGDLDFALKVYDDMEKNGVAPDEMFLSTLVDVAGHAGKLDAGFKVLHDARAKGIKVGSMSYSSLMGACCNAKNWKKALELYEEIKAMKFLPTVPTLNALVTSLCGGNQVKKSFEVLDHMKNLGVRPNVVTYSVLIVACERNAEAELGFALFSEAKKNNIPPNLIMCRCLTGLFLQSFKKACSLGESVVVFHSGRPKIECKWTSMAIQVYRETVQAGIKPSVEVFSQVLGCLQFPHDCSLRNQFIENLGFCFDASKCFNISSMLDGFGEYDTRCFSILEEAITLGLVHRISLKDGPIFLDARKLLLHIPEVYLLNILNGLKHRLAAGAKLPTITILLPTEKTEIGLTKGETTISVAGRVGQSVGSLLRRMGLSYQGDESYGKIRITGLALRRWFKPKLNTTSSFAGTSAEMISNPTRLAKGIMDQQRNIRSLSLY